MTHLTPPVARRQRHTFPRPAVPGTVETANAAAAGLPSCLCASSLAGVPAAAGMPIERSEDV